MASPNSLVHDESENVDNSGHVDRFMVLLRPLEKAVRVNDFPEKAGRGSVSFDGKPVRARPTAMHPTAQQRWLGVR